MEKPIIATTLTGIFLDKKPWENAHLMWFEDAAKKLDRIDINDWGLIYHQEKDYFPKIYEIMDLMYPNLNLEDKTKKARELFFYYVLKYINENGFNRFEDTIEYFQELKSKYRIALVSTQSELFTREVLDKTNLNDLFDIIYCASASDKDDKKFIYSKFVSEYGEPIIHLDKPMSLDEIKKLIK